MPTHYTNYKYGNLWYPGERAGSWVSDKNGRIYTLTPGDTIPDYTVEETGVKLPDFLAEQHGISVAEVGLSVLIGTHGANASPGVLGKFVQQDPRYVGANFESMVPMNLSMATIRGHVTGKECAYVPRTSFSETVPFTLVNSKGTTPFYGNIIVTEGQLVRMNNTEGLRREGLEEDLYKAAEIVPITFENDQEFPGLAYVGSGIIYNEDGSAIGPANSSYLRTHDIEGIPVDVKGSVLPQRAQSEMTRIFSDYIGSLDEFDEQPLYDGNRLNGYFVGVPGSEGRNRFTRARTALMERFGTPYKQESRELAHPFEPEEFVKPFA
jgi:hypothetical protein